MKIETIHRSMFTVTGSAHNIDLCAECRQCAADARLHASVTGSVGATYRVTGGSLTTYHSATVNRVREDGSLVEPTL